MQICDITGKGKQYGNNVSFSQRHTKKVWKPNLQNKTVIVDGKKVRLKVSTQGIRILKKKGLIVPYGTEPATSK
jgi:large subunit ribosomal protein L28